jgi:hypothetical protein
MNPTNALHDLGQRLWLDNITRKAKCYREFVDQFKRASIEPPSELSDRTRSGDYFAKEI